MLVKDLSELSSHPSLLLLRSHSEIVRILFGFIFLYIEQYRRLLAVRNIRLDMTLIAPVESGLAARGHF